MKCLLLVEHDNHSLKEINLHVLAAAKQFNGTIDLLIVGNHCDSVIDEASTLPGIREIFVKEGETYEHQLAENVANMIADIGKNYEVLLAPATTFGKNILPRAAALLDSGMISDVTKIIAPDTFLRPIYAGNAFETVKSNDKIKILTVRGTAFPPEEKGAKREVPITKITKDYLSTDSKFVSQELTKSTRPELTSARIIVSGGRGLKSAENFKLLEQLADALGAAVGASRAAVDAGFAPNDYQVGQTGKIVAPDLYIAVGISGAIQHLAGMKDSKVIVAINSDPDAPIFQIADYGLVSDLFSALQELQKELGK